MDDREVIAASAAGDPAGIAAAYDKYAAGLYIYCQWMLNQPADAAEALRDTFVVASVAIGDLAEDTRLRPWLYAVARREGQRRLRTAVPSSDGQPDADGRPADPDELPDVRGDIKPAELLSMIHAILAELPHREREVIELSLRHDLHDADLAEALGVSWSRAHALSERARGRLEKALGALLVARTGREACSELDRALTDWDGRLTDKARDLIAGHVEQCQTCTARRLGALRPALLSGLQPLAPLPPGLREQVLGLSSSAAPDAAAYRRRATRRAKSARLSRVSRVITLVRWANIRANPGAALAIAVTVMWVVAAASVILLTFAGSRPAHALTARPSTGPPSASPAAATAPATISSSPAGKPSPKVSRPQIITSPTVQSSTFIEPPASPSPTPSRSPSPSPSPSPSKSPSPSPSGTTSPSASPSRSASPSPTGTS
jgi:RNA polymerase sigma factor (sigma-70 family)